MAFNKNRHLSLLFRFMVFFILTFIPSIAQTPSSIDSLQKEVIALSKDPILSNGFLAVSVIDTKTGTAIFDYNSDKSLMPASNLKLLTTGAALGILGGDYKFKTTINYTGQIKGGVLYGNLIIQGGGDPTLGGGRIDGNQDMKTLLNTWASKIKALGITKVQGNIISDASIFEYNPVGDFYPWSDIGNYYGGGVTGLNLNENIYKIYFKSGPDINSPTSILKTEPEMKNIIFKNEVRTGKLGSGDNAYIYGAPYSFERYINGTIPKGSQSFPIKGSIPDPPLFVAQSLLAALKNNSVAVSGNAKKFDQSERVENLVLIYEHFSPPLREIVKETNVYSINLYAEALCKMLGVVSKQKAGTMEAGTAQIKDFWEEKGIDIQGMFLFDGSGLSLNNGITSKQLVTALNVITREKWFVDFYNSLSVAGESGTLGNLCKGTKAEKNLRGKSGSVKNVLCYSGYVKNSQGNTLAFSVLTNKYSSSTWEIKKRLEKILVIVSEL